MDKGKIMNSTLFQSHFEVFNGCQSMQKFGEVFIEALPQHIGQLKIPGRTLIDSHRREPVMAQVTQTDDIQNAMLEVLNSSITQKAQSQAESAFDAFLKKQNVDSGVLKFFNGWNETHKTTRLVSAKIIMRLSADALYVPLDSREGYPNVMAHMHEVAKDDFGLGHKGHDGMYHYMTAAFGATDWVNNQYKVNECNAFSEFLYDAGVAEHKSPMNSDEYKLSIMDAMMVSIASELWNGREYNFIAQHIENKLLAINPSLSSNAEALRNAKGYVMGHAGEVENRHGLHALAAAQAYGRVADLTFKVDRLKEVMLNYNGRVGIAFKAMHSALTATP
jgi:hypothetical protein